MLDIIPSAEVSAAMGTNRHNALSLALLLHFDKVGSVPLLDILTTLCNFSYKGDIRMRWKMENPDKVRNIVIGQFDSLLELYRPLLADL